jgi:hypothetical protein
MGSVERAARSSPGSTHERECRGGEHKDDRHGQERGLRRRRVRQRPDRAANDVIATAPTPRPHGLPTIKQSLYDQGRTCERLLIAATRGELAGDDLVHLAPWQLVTRESTGPPPPS